MLSVARRAPRPVVPEDVGAGKPAPDEGIAYRGYRVEPASYCISTGAWGPRAVVSLKNEEGTSPGTPLYSNSAARFVTREEADRRAVGVARAWIDAALERRT